MDILCGAEQIPETVVETTLRASCGSHHPIMITPHRKSYWADGKRRTGSAKMRPGCRENQLSGEVRGESVSEMSEDQAITVTISEQRPWQRANQ